MTREEFAEKVRWSWVIWIVGIINPGFMLPQLFKIWEQGNASSISLTSLGILLFIQTGFGLHGFLRRDTLLMVVTH